jgi:hypothetical protein
LLGLLLTRFGKFSLTLGMTLQIDYKLLGTDQRAVGRRGHWRASSGPILRPDHTVIEAGHRRLPEVKTSGGHLARSHPQFVESEEFSIGHFPEAMAISRWAPLRCNKGLILKD